MADALFAFATVGFFAAACLYTLAIDRL